MKASLLRHTKVVDEAGNILEIRIWELPASIGNRPHRYKYSLAYIVGGIRVVGYDNAEDKGDHRHYGDSEEPYKFQGVDKLISDFYEDVRRSRK